MMVPFIALLVLLCIVSGSTAYFFLPYIRRHQRKLDEGESAAEVARLQESIDDLTTQVHLLEEEKDFYRELRSPHGTPKIESESEEEPDSGGSHGTGSEPEP